MREKPQLALDTCILGEIKCGNISLEKVLNSNAEYYIPVTQESEFTTNIEQLRKTHPTTAAAIDEVIQELDYTPSNVDSAPYATGGYSHGPYDGGESPHYNKIWQQLDNTAQESRDAIGADAAINRDLMFVTADKDLRAAIENYAPGHSMSKEQFVAFLDGDVEL